MSHARPKVLLAMSGGVDSSVAAVLLQADGYEVVGCFMRLGSPGEELADGLCEVDPSSAIGNRQSTIRIGHQGCCSINDAKDAQLVAAQLGISFYVLNFKRDFGRVIDYFTAEYNAGRTPNPCVRCNDWLKFGKLADYARSIDADYVASGHYARLVKMGSDPILMRGVDRDKDQSYVLFGASRDSLRHTLFPVGDYRKSEIRSIAREHDLPVFDKPDSQEICFVPSGDYMDVVTRVSPDHVRPGDLLDTAGNVLGSHPGHQHFTVGQRRGVGVALGHPVYVIDKNPATNTVTVGPREKLAAAGLIADQTNWLVDPPAGPIHCSVKIRYNADLVGATVQAVSRAGSSSTPASYPDRLRVAFDQPQFAVAPGQAVVCYDGDRVLAGGWITRAVSNPQSPNPEP